MKTAWTKGLESDQAKEMEGYYNSSPILRARLEKLLQDKLEGNLKESRAKDGYENPNWAYKQADSRGYERALQEVLSLIE